LADVETANSLFTKSVGACIVSSSPAAKDLAAATALARIAFRWMKDGSLADIRAVVPSGSDALDKIAVRCVGIFRFDPTDFVIPDAGNPSYVDINWKNFARPANDRADQTSPPPTEQVAAGDVKLGKAHTCLHGYPKDLALAGVEGVTKLTFTITDEGHVTDIKVAQSSGHSQFDDAAVLCAKHWKYHPAVQDGRAIASSWTAEIAFHLTTHSLDLPSEPVETVIVSPDAPPN
jgi:TonB family protein